MRFQRSCFTVFALSLIYPALAIAQCTTVSTSQDELVMVGNFIMTATIPVSSTNYYVTDLTTSAGCSTGKTNCSGMQVSYSTVSVAANWSVAATRGGVNYTFTADDVQTFWDWAYAGYGGGGPPDFTKNCHGYSLGVGDWPFSGATGVQRILNASADPNYIAPTACYTKTTPADTRAKIAMTSGFGHSVKVTITTCVASSGSVHVEFPTLTATSEKFRVSAVYTQSVNCPTQEGTAITAVDINKMATKANAYLSVQTSWSYYFSN